MSEFFINKNYIITGATSGIGFSTAKLLLEAGANVLGIGRDLSKVNTFINHYPDKFVFLNVNLDTDFDITNDMTDFVLKKGKFNGFVNCAGKEETLPLSMYSRKKVKEIFDVNLNAPMEILRMFCKKKFSEDYSSVIMLSSVMGELGQPGKTAYCSSKSALLGLVRSAALELSPRKVRVNAISPGVVDTPMTQKLFDQLSSENIEAIKNMHPLGTGEVSDITPMILFLLGDGARWITGQNFVIDGGYSVR